MDQNLLLWHHEDSSACKKYTPNISIRTQSSVNIQGTASNSNYAKMFIPPHSFTTAKNEQHRRSLLSGHLTSSKPIKLYSSSITVSLLLTTKDTADGDHESPSWWPPLRPAHDRKYGQIMQRRASKRKKKRRCLRPLLPSVAKWWHCPTTSGHRDDVNA